MFEDKLFGDAKEIVYAKQDKNVLSKIMNICFTYKTFLNKPYFFKIKSVLLNEAKIKYQID